MMFTSRPKRQLSLRAVAAGAVFILFGAAIPSASIATDMTDLKAASGAPERMEFTGSYRYSREAQANRATGNEAADAQSRAPLAHSVFSPDAMQPRFSSFGQSEVQASRIEIAPVVPTNEAPPAVVGEPSTKHIAKAGSPEQAADKALDATGAGRVGAGTSIEANLEAATVKEAKTGSNITVDAAPVKGSSATRTAHARTEKTDAGPMQRAERYDSANMTTGAVRMSDEKKAGGQRSARVKVSSAKQTLPPVTPRAKSARKPSTKTTNRRRQRSRRKVARRTTKTARPKPRLTTTPWVLDYPKWAISGFNKP